jgi:hypothetical protein
VGDLLRYLRIEYKLILEFSFSYLEIIVCTGNAERSWLRIGTGGGLL